MKVGSLFSGIGGFDRGLELAGMEVMWAVEKDPQAQAVLKHHWPNMEVYEDVTKEGGATLAPVDLICMGWPCQDLSVAGRRAGLSGERSGLFWEAARILGELRPRWVLGENVPGLLSSHGGWDMASVIGSLAELGYVGAYRVLDAQYFGVAQRRRRVFLVGCLGERGAEQVLFDAASLQRHPPTRREEGQGVAGSLEARAATGGYDPGAHGADLTKGVDSQGKGGYAGRRQEDDYNIVAEVTPISNDALRGEGVAQSPSADAEGRVRLRDPGLGVGEPGDPSFTIPASGAPAVAFAQNQRGELRTSEISPQLTTGGGKPGEGYPAVYGFSAGNSGDSYGVGAEEGKAPPIRAGASGTNQAPTAAGVSTRPRRLTPTECCRLQGFPDDWFDGVRYKGKPLADGPRYRMLGNAVAVPVAEWLGRRILKVAS